MDRGSVAISPISRPAFFFNRRICIEILEALCALVCSKLHIFYKWQLSSYSVPMGWIENEAAGKYAYNGRGDSWHTARKIQLLGSCNQLLQARLVLDGEA